MARSFGKIEATFWQNPRVRSLSEPGRFLLGYLFACPHGNTVGCFRLPLGYAQDDLMWPLERVRKHLSEVVRSGFVDYDEATSIVRVVGWFGHNTIENPNVAKAAVRAINSLPTGRLRDATIKALADIGNKFFNEVANTVETRSEPVSKHLPTPEPEPIPEPEPDIPPDASHPAPKGARAKRGDVSGLEADFEAWWAQYPRRKAKDAARAAYAKARTKAGISAADLLAGAMRYAAERQSQDPKFTAHPATWLNEGRWADEPEKPHERNRPEATNPSGISDAVGSAVANAVARQVAGQRPNPRPNGGAATPGPGGNADAAGAAEHRADRGGSGPAARMGQGHGDGAEGIGRGGVGLSGGSENHPGGPVIDGDTAIEIVAPLRQPLAAGERNPLPGAGGNGRTLSAEDAVGEGGEVQGRAGGTDAISGHDASAESGVRSDAGGLEQQIQVANRELTDDPLFLRRTA